MKSTKTPDNLNEERLFLSDELRSRLDESLLSEESNNNSFDEITSLDPEDADEFVEEAEKHGHAIIGHTLVWHAMAPPWIFKDKGGKEVSARELRKRMKEHIYKILKLSHVNLIIYPNQLKD